MVRILFVAMALATLLTAYQNCARKLDPDVALVNNATSASSTGSSANTPTVVVPSFKSGDIFDYSLVPSAAQSQMVAVQLADSMYASSTSARAIAVAQNGLGYVAISPSNSQAEANQMALESCFAISGSQPCALLATAGTFALAQTDLALASTFSFKLSALSAVTAASLPFLSAADKTAAAAKFAQVSSPKAIAVSIDGTYMIAAGNGLFGTKTDSSKIPLSASKNVPNSETEAKRLAMEMCEMMSKYLPCTLIASNASVSFQPNAINFTPVIDYQPTSITSVPGVSASIFNQYIAPNLGSYFVYISADGNGAAYASSSQAQSTCQNYATATNGTTYPCFVYSQARSVKMMVQNLSAIKAHSLATHCEVMPRATCAAHADVGCTNGKFYTINAGQVALTQCP